VLWLEGLTFVRHWRTLESGFNDYRRGAARFAADAVRLLGEEGRDRLIEFLSSNPRAGVVIPGTGGIRKLRWSASGRGKRGGSRVIYYFHSESIPLFALKLYAKNEESDLSEQDKRLLASQVEGIKQDYGV